MENRTLKSKDIISVIISAYNSERTIGKTLQSLEAQDIDKNLYEVIISDDGSTTEKTKAIVESFITRWNMNLIYSFAEHAWVGSARNRGIALSSGKTLAFTDADCICDSDWLSVIYKNIVWEKKQFIGGYTYSNDTVIFPWKMAPVGQSGITANLAIDFTLLEIPVFDSWFTEMLGDDTDFVLRMEARGVILYYIPEMRVLHPPNIIGMTRIIIRARGKINEVCLYKKHGKKVMSSFSPIFRPIIFSRISLFSLMVCLWTVGMLAIYDISGLLGLLGLWLSFFVLFELYLYRFFVIYSPDNRCVSFYDRTKTFFYFLVTIPLFFYYRIIGIVRFKFFML